MRSHNSKTDSSQIEGVQVLKLVNLNVMVKVCSLGTYSRPRAQLFPIRTDLNQQITCLFFLRDCCERALNVRYVTEIDVKEKGAHSFK